MDRIFAFTKKRVLHENMRTILTMAIVFVLAVISMYGTYRALMHNARVMGLELVRSYAADEERNIAVYKTTVKMAIEQLNGLEEDGLPQDKIEEKMIEFFDHVGDSIGDTELTGYTISHNRIVSKNLNEAWLRYHSGNARWYQKIMDADGEVVFQTKEMEDGENVVIAAAGNPDTGDVVFLRISQDCIKKTHGDLNLPEEGAYYLFDAEGNLLFYDAPFQADEAAMEEYATGLCQKIQKESIAESGNTIMDINGSKQGIYHNQISNGWLCIMTIPHETVLLGINEIIGIYAGVLILCLGVLLLMGVRDIRMAKTVEKSNTIVRALCNTFYAIYRINLKTETYEMIKGTTEMQELIPKKGSYQEMMDGFVQVVDEHTAVELTRSFSIEHLKKLGRKGISDYGGDFQRRLNGDIKWVNISFILDDALGKEEAVLAFRQIDAEKKRQLKHTKLLENALEAADASEKSQIEFFSKMSHEMRTPLNIILGMNELAMKQDCGEEKRMDYLQKIEQSGKEMLSLINNILEMSRVNHGLMPSEKKAFDLAEEFQKIVKPFYDEATAAGKNFTIESEISNARVAGDTLKLTQILGNILSNALRFTHKEDSITVSLRQAGLDSRNYIFVIADTGIGMSEEFLPKLFEPYTQEKQFRAQTRSDGGLGMSVVKSLVSQMNGQIEVESAVGKGTKVIVTLPFEPQEDDAKEATNQSIDIKDGMKNMRMLVVDDNELNRELLCDLLQEQEVEVIPAKDGCEAVELFQQSELFSIDAIIMDMQMPVMDGCEATEAIRALERPDAQWVHIIAVTANFFSEDVMRTTQAGMNAHLCKPVNIKLLQQTLEKLIAERERGN